ncbi:MAG: tetratricopeptide repeat protein [Planctomycetes bacterium]|nr:tetratricopeptide repeat protein [Planctomycetota bacterium]MCH9727232.1 tetratricopeptide repeat protein [Planctomycetota bacterium]MCH9776727.1 tetratricopeptide repeat protein [Planctomycetota bacterium]MDF1745209.1 tetratricopeptide repeat protein [Gimesia sp.]
MAEENINQPEPDESASVGVKELPDSAAEKTGVDDTTAEQLSLRAKLTKFARARWEPLAISAAVLVLTLVYFWTTSGAPEKTPKQILAEALIILESSEDQKTRNEAQEMAYTLKKMEYQDPDFPGALYFIFGVVSFRNAEELTGESQDHQYLIASRYLKEAEKRAVDQDHRPEWTFALGTCLYLLGAMKDSRPLLEEAIKTYPPGKLKTSMLLTDIYLDDKAEADLNQAFELNTEALQTEEMNPVTLDRLYLQRAQIFLAQGKNSEAQQVLAKVKQKDSVNQVTVVFQAQTLMAEKKYREALAILAPVKDNLGLERKFSRQASYLMGLCAESLNDSEAAIGFYEQTTHRYAGSHEGLAAYLHLGDLLRKNGRTEEALIAYRAALRSINSPQDFRNRWMNLEQVQAYVLDAWNDWVDEEKIQNGVTTFDTAIQLADFLPPLLPEVQARELAANANRRWAEYYERLVEASPMSQHEEMKPKLKERWKQSGLAYYDLSRLLQTTDRYGEILSVSAEHFQKGQDFETAIKVLTRFINTKPDKKMPQALVRRGEILIELDQLDDAINHFERVMTNYPTDVASFEAKYLLGVTYLEKDELDQASRIWNEILESSILTPKAKQWKDSLFALGKLNYHRGKIADIQTAESKNDTKTEEQPVSEVKIDYYEEATKRLSEYVNRYPESEQVHEARYLLARSLQNQAGRPRQEMKSAKTENARMELKRKEFAYLKMANLQLQILNRELRKLETQDRLDSLGKRLLKSACFGTAHLLYRTEEYNEAIKSYHDAVNRYPQCTEVLIAYMKMSGCYESLGKKNEAKSMLEQAKIILKQMPDKVFESKATNLGREEWNRWLDWSRGLRKSNAKINQLQTGNGV